MKDAKKKNIGHFTVLNDRGLHCRPSTEIVKCTNQFKCEIFLNYKKMRINGKSLFAVLTLAAPRGAKIKIEAIGDDAEESIAALIALSEKSFNIHY